MIVHPAYRCSDDCDDQLYHSPRSNGHYTEIVHACEHVIREWYPDAPERLDPVAPGASCRMPDHPATRPGQPKEENTMTDKPVVTDEVEDLDGTIRQYNRHTDTLVATIPPAAPPPASIAIVFTCDDCALEYFPRNTPPRLSAIGIDYPNDPCGAMVHAACAAEFVANGFDLIPNFGDWEGCTDIGLFCPHLPGVDDDL